MCTRPVLLLLLLAWGLALSTSAHAQITIERGDFEIVPGAVATINAQAVQDQTSTIQDLLVNVGPGGVYDFSSVQVRGTLAQREIQAAPFDGSVPDDPAFDAAEFVNIAGQFGPGFTTYDFFCFEEAAGGAPNGRHNLGSVTPASSTRIEYTPSLLTVGLPLTYPGSWTSGEVTEETYSGGVLQNSISVTHSGEVIGYGDVLFPGGERVPALVQALTQVEETDTTHAISFVTEGRKAVTVITDGNRNVLEFPDGTGGTVPAFFVNLESDAGAVAEIGAGETGSFLGGDLGLSIDVTTGSSAAFTLQGYRIDFSSLNNGVDDTGTPAGFPVEHVSQVFWSATIPGTSSLAVDATYTVCLDYGGLSGIANQQELAVLKRDGSAEPWRPQASTVDVGLQRVCAADLTSLSEFAVGGSSSNPLPVELAGFEARMDGDAVHLTWRTASETNNAGFEVERSRNETDFTPVGFVPGHNTSTEARTYRFDDTRVPFDAEQLTYRLRQVDHDGMEQIAGTVEVELSSPDRVALFAPFPNPARDQMTLRYALPTATTVEIYVYNVLGQRVATLLDRPHAVGRAELTVDAGQWPTGTYFVRLAAGGQIVSRRLIVMR